jgi:hypothetical protein
MNVPKLLTTLSGEEVTTVEIWRHFRREEILQLFCDHVYGRRDMERPDDESFVLVKEETVCGMRKKELRCAFHGYSFPFSLYLPIGATEPCPAFIYVMHENLENTMELDTDGNMESRQTESVLPLKAITDRGYAVAIMPTRDIYREWTLKMNYKHGVFNTVKTEKGRDRHSWASISAWAWGVSRVVDYLETDADINHLQIASIGHSRSGKAALYAAATDERILLGVPNNTGCMGAALLRGKRGEHAADINISDWFCEKFRDYNDAEHLLPVDQHMLLALLAPRYLYVTCSEMDEWADPAAELRAARLASEAFELYGVRGLVAPEVPVVDEVYQEGHIAYHVKTGDHSQTDFDWYHVMNYFDKIRVGAVR